MASTSTLIPEQSSHNNSGNDALDEGIRDAPYLRQQIEKLTELVSELSCKKIAMDAHSLVSITDVKGKITYVNDMFCVVSGYSREQLEGSNHRLLNSGNKPKDYWRQMYLDVSNGRVWKGEIRNKTKSGDFYWVQTTIVPKYNGANEFNGYISIRTDITDNKAQQEQFRLMAHYDVLTRLPNRALFVDRFNQSIAHSIRNEKQLAVCFLDLDDFKPVNDNYGHEVGDQLLIEVAKRIKASIREEDTVSRQGGDEFALLLNDIESFAQCELTLERIHHELAQPYVINDTNHKITVSSGVTLYPNDEGDIDTLIRHADQAMYQAKLAGKNRYYLFNPVHDLRTIQKHHQLEEIEHALANNEFQLYYQPKVNMVNGNVYGVEALIRWIHPEKGLIPPLDFLPAIGGTDLEIEIGEWVINEALVQLERWQQQGIRLEVSVNISSHHMLSKFFFDQLKATLAKYPSIDPQHLQLEIVESSALGDIKLISTIVKFCQGALGVRVALDDFGTGYSSLTHLRNLPAEIIKIDQSFVRDILDDPNDYSIIKGIVGLADSFGREIIGEGVETTNHGLMLLMMGCEDAQGYGIAKPMPADDFPLWLEDYIPNPVWQKYGNKYHSSKENKVNLFRLVTEHWKGNFINNIESVHNKVEHWPIMCSKQCHCGSWIKRARQELLYTVGGLIQLDKAHEALHLAAQALHIQYKAGNVDAAREDLPKFQRAFDSMIDVMELCK
jgi:diguanylate cyclase (GGDEF)-like protein/PAS domain S-box-containing protein